ncbi:hypothetical protein N7532_007018 [Penicillium argentinense]|uniref:Uncharacterized protein n=1 Tax=Penicillium argentinense TaxID=1131581 RepID=A0A9W9FH01_9EURO|nr:uncharacterized protein N7532_007018 [Penicillium argentinense]KAJ5100017.1 hypothetical protein N7532_007018 [Penicillium argentinense]
MSSNSSTAGSHPYSSDMEESAFLKRNRLIHCVCLGLSVVISAAAIAIIACEAVPLRHYKDTAKWATDDLTLWPLNFDLRPTIAALSCGCVIAALNLVYVITAILPSPHSRIKLLNSYSSLSAITGFITALVGILFIIYRPSSSYPSGFTVNETLESWTCKWKNGSTDETTPVHFSRDCIDTRAGFALLCATLGLEIFMGVAAGFGSVSQRGVSRRREEQFQLEKLEIATKQVYRG